MCSVSTAYTFTVKYNILFSLFEFGLGVLNLISTSTSSFWPHFTSLVWSTDIYTSLIKQSILYYCMIIWNGRS